jgi:transposase-like protein
MLDSEVAKFKSRPLGYYEYPFLDAQYEKVRHDGCAKADGVNEEGYMEALAV